MNSGSLRQRVVVQSETKTSFEGGAYTTSWTTDSTEWASVRRDISTNETYAQDKEQQMTYFNVVMRDDVTITNKNRLLFNNNILVIETVEDPSNRNRQQILKCRLENT